MISEMINHTSWSVEYILKMPVRRFFTLSKHLNDIHREDLALNYLEMCDISFIPSGTQDYHNGLKSYYRQMLNPEYRKKAINIREFNMENEEERAQAARILESTFAQQARLMGLR